MISSESLHGLTTLSRQSGHCYRLSVRDYPTGDVEITAIQLDPDTRLGNRSCKKRVNVQKETMDETTLKKSQSRSKKVIRQKALTMQADRLLTLTFKDNVTDISESWDCLKYFNKLMRWRFGKRYSYIAVPEYQKRGAIHFHLAIHGYYCVRVVRRLWLRATGKRGGNIDITTPRRKSSWNPKRITDYLAKYITKQDTVEFNKRRYSASTNINVPPVTIAWLSLGVPVVTVMLDILKSLSRMPYDKISEYDTYYKITHVTT